MPLLIGATILLIASHLLPSAPGERLIARLGRGGFYAWYSLLSLLALGFVLWAYRAAEVGPLLYLLARWAGLDLQVNRQPPDRAQALATPARLN
jgi:uncharacterized membrane protein